MVRRSAITEEGEEGEAGEEKEEGEGEETLHSAASEGDADRVAAMLKVRAALPPLSAPFRASPACARPSAPPARSSPPVPAPAPRSAPGSALLSAVHLPPRL